MDREEIAIVLKEVTKKIGSKTIIDGLSLEIYRGEVFGLLGPNGAGKTTTIRMMVGLISLTAGEIMIHGWSIAEKYTKAIAQVGAIVENPEFYRFLTGYANLVHFANMHPNVSQKRIDEVVALVGLESRIHDTVKSYSLGMRQRLGVAQALLHHPSVLILDEPTNGLDPAGIKEMRDYLRQLARHAGVTVVVSSHLLTEMELMCDRAAFIKNGKLLDVKSVGKSAPVEQVNFEVNSPQNAVNRIKAGLPGIPVFLVENGFRVTADRELIAAITALLVDAGIKVYGIGVKSKTLEELFMEVTGDGTTDKIDLQ
jgi:ABC-2 type transport system ATP-binding protein